MITPSYAIVSCPHCGFLSISKFTKTHRCPKCNRNFTIEPKRKQSRIAATFYTQQEARQFLYRLKEYEPGFEPGSEA
jgi:tRNA(Ile2) C34 agmatinyltransferase TiaS